MKDTSHRASRSGSARTIVAEDAPGKQTSTQGLPPRDAGALQLSPSEPALVDGDTARSHGLETFDPHAVASAGLAGGADALPHLDTIQRSFGRHDIGGVRAHVGGAANEAAGTLGARAFATGDRIGFASDPDVFLAAHEAAHVIQQRGGMTGMGQGGDRHEQHADEVASAVAGGRSAESLLDSYAGGGGTGGGGLQLDEEGRALARNVRFTLNRALNSGPVDQRERARQGIRDLNALGDDPDPAAVRQIANTAGVRAMPPVLDDNIRGQRPAPPGGNDNPDDEAPPPRRQQTPVIERPLPTVVRAAETDAEREEGQTLMRNVRDQLLQRADDGDEQAVQGLRELEHLGEVPHPDEVRRVAQQNGITPSTLQPRAAVEPQVGLNGVRVPVGGGSAQIGLEQGGGSITGTNGQGNSIGVGGTAQLGADGLEGGDAQLTAGQGDLRATIRPGITYTARRPARRGDRYAVAWRIEIRAEAGLSNRLRGVGIGATAGGAITREGTDMFESLDAANEFRDSFREMSNDYIVDRFFRTATADQRNGDFWTSQPVGTTRTVRLTARLTPNIRGTLAQLLDVSVSLPMRASASASVRKTSEAAVQVTESFEVGAGVDPSVGATGLSANGTLGTGLHNNIRYNVTYVFSVDLHTGRAALDAFLERDGLVWEGQAGVTEVSHSSTTESFESGGVSAGPLGRGQGQRGTSETTTETPDGEQQNTHRGFQRDQTNNITGEYNRRNFDVSAPTDDRPYEVTTDIHSNDGETSRELLGQDTDTPFLNGNEEESESSGNWRLREQLTQEQMQTFHVRFTAQSARGGSIPHNRLHRTLRGIPTDESGREQRAAAISEFLSEEGRRGLNMIYGVIGSEPSQELRLFTQNGEDTNFMREEDLRGIEQRCGEYGQAINEGRGGQIAPLIQTDIGLLEPRLAAISDRSRYTDLNDTLRARQVARYQGLLDRLRPLLEQAQSGRTPQPPAQQRPPEYRESNVENTSVHRPARLSDNDAGEDAAILDHIETRGIRVLLDEHEFWLDDGRSVSLVAARRVGEEDGATRWLCTLRVVSVDQGMDQGLIGQTFQRTVVGREHHEPAP